MKQLSKEWFAAKVGKLSGSRFNDLMATTGGRDAIPARPAKETVRDESGAVIQRASKATPEKPALPGKPTSARANLVGKLVAERLTGEITEVFQNFAMKRGIELEPYAVAAYENSELVCVDSVGFVQHPDHEFIGVSPDGYVGEDGLVEIKCPLSSGKHLNALKEYSHYDEYKWQVQGQLWVTGRSWCEVVSFDPRMPKHLQLAIIRVHPDPEMIKQLEDACIVANDEVLENIKLLEEKYA